MKNEPFFQKRPICKIKGNGAVKEGDTKDVNEMFVKITTPETIMNIVLLVMCHKLFGQKFVRKKCKGRNETFCNLVISSQE